MERSTRRKKAMISRDRVFEGASVGYLSRLCELGPDITTSLLLVALRRGEKDFRHDVLAMSIVEELVPAMALSRIGIMIRFLASETGWGGRSLLGRPYDVYLDMVEDIASLMDNSNDRSSLKKACSEVKDTVDKPLFSLPENMLLQLVSDWHSKLWNSLTGYTDFDIASAFGCSVDAARRSCMELKNIGTLDAVSIPYFVPLLYHADAPIPPIKVTKVTSNALLLSGLEFQSTNEMWDSLRHIEEIVAELDGLR